MFSFIFACAPLSEPPALLSEGEQSEGRTSFFQAFQQADYSSLDESIELLTREYLDGDSKSTATLGFAHAWRLAESGRVEDGPARVIESADLAVRYFYESSQEFPTDPRLKGFLGSFKQAQGSIHGHPELQKEGWFDQKDAVRDWPEWGLFTQAYGLITKSPDESRYQKGIELLWHNIDECIDGKIDRNDFDYRSLFDQVQEDSDPRNYRACANTTIVPYNVQGFFTVFGDFYAKANDLENAARMYETALELPGADTWPYHNLAEQRLLDLEELSQWFSHEPERGTQIDARNTTIFSGPYNCSVCHANNDITLSDDSIE